jgi:glycosyltransferase involved in cell wall biosynthesis
MRLLFVHDNRFEQGEDGRIYTSGTFPSALWGRYLRHFEQVTVLAREGRNRGATEDLIRADFPSVSFDFAPDIGSVPGVLVNRRAARKKIGTAIGSADAVVARLPSELGFVAADLAIEAGAPLAVEVAGCAWDAAMNHGSLPMRSYAPLFFHRMRRAVSRAPLAIYVTREWLQGRYPTTGEAVGCSDVEITSLADEDRERRHRRLAELANGRPPRLGTIASLAQKYKGLHLAIKAVAHLRSNGLSYSYSVLGPGDPQPWRALAAAAGVGDLVSFDGTCEAGAAVRKWLDDIDIHLQPSLAEGLPRATIEAMSRGVACIGSTCGGIPELLPPSQLHRRGDAIGLAESIRRLAADPKRMAEAAWSGLEAAQLYLPESLSRCQDAAYGRLAAMAWAARGTRTGNAG